MKKKVILTIMVALSVAIAGCGTKNADTAETKKEIAVKNADNEKTENLRKDSEGDIEKSEESKLKVNETIIKEDEKAVEQQEDSIDSNTSDKNNVSNNSTSSSSSNTTGNSNSGATSGNTSSGGSGNANTNNNSGNNTSNSNMNPTPAPTPEPEQPVHTHTWVHHEATGHNETVTIQAAWDEEVPLYGNVEHSICNQCGADITGFAAEHIAEGIATGTCWAYHSDWKYEQTSTQTIHHDAVTEQRWVQDTAAYDQCSGCGVVK